MQILTVCRIDEDWAFRDVTGEMYGRSTDISVTYDAAQRVAGRIGALIEFSAEAKAHYRSVAVAQATGIAEPPISRAGRFQNWLIGVFSRR